MPSFFYNYYDIIILIIIFLSIIKLGILESEPMAYQIKISNFEGPFDLLFHLIEKAEVDIYDIPISEITNQYLEYIYSIENIDLDNASEFIVMAALLIQIKSKMLLPKETNPLDELTADGIDPRAELIERLLEYKRYKTISEILKEMELIQLDVVYKPAEIIDDIEENKILYNVTIDDIVNAFKDVIKRFNENNSDKEELQHEIIEEEYTVDDKIESIRDMIKTKNHLSFRDLFFNILNKFEIIITFLALLELIRLREIKVHQERVFGEINIKYADEEGSYGRELGNI